MKKTFKAMCMAFVLVGTMSFVACGDKEEDTPTPQPTPRAAGNGTYALHFPEKTSAALADGDTVTYTVQDWEHELGMAYINFFVENQTSADLLTDQKVDVISGPTGLQLTICANGECPAPPAVPPAYTIPANTVYDSPFQVEPHLSSATDGKQALVKVTVGKADDMDNGVVAYLKINL